MLEHPRGKWRFIAGKVLYEWWVVAGKILELNLLNDEFPWISKGPSFSSTNASTNGGHEAKSGQLTTYQPSHHAKAPLLPPKNDPTSINPTRVNIQKRCGKATVSRSKNMIYCHGGFSRFSTSMSTLKQESRFTSPALAIFSTPGVSILHRRLVLVSRGLADLGDSCAREPIYPAIETEKKSCERWVFDGFWACVKMIENA